MVHKTLICLHLKAIKHQWKSADELFEGSFPVKKKITQNPAKTLLSMLLKKGVSIDKVRNNKKVPAAVCLSFNKALFVQNLSFAL